MRMPLMNGVEVILRLRALDPQLPAIVVTAYTADDTAAHALRVGVLAMLAKPVSIPRLLELLGSARRNGVVVVVEDDPALLDNMTEILQLNGFAAVPVRSVLEMAALDEARPFAAVVDLRVAGGPDGEAMRRLAERCPGIPMVVVSGYADLAAPLLPAALHVA
jgi:DNA-binding NtrC family response regulator